MRILEKAMPYWGSFILSCVGVFAMEWLDVLKPLHDADLRTAAGVIAQVSATLAGFLLAVLSILATIANTKLVRNMQKTGHFRFLLKRLFVDTGVLGVAVVLGMIAAISSPSRYLIDMLIFFALLGLTMLVDVSHKLWTVLNHLHPSVDS